MRSLRWRPKKRCSIREITNFRGFGQSKVSKLQNSLVNLDTRTYWLTGRDTRRRLEKRDCPGFNGTYLNIVYYTRCNTLKLVTSRRGPYLHHCAQATQLLSKKCHSGGEPLATLCLIWPARDLKFRPPAPEANVLLLDSKPKDKT